MDEANSTSLDLSEPEPAIAEPATPPPTPLPGVLNATSKPRPIKKGLKIVGLILGLTILVGGAYAYYFYRNITNQILDQANASDAASLDLNAENSQGKINPANFPTLGSGRYSILLLGVDKAAGLTDSIQVMSFDTINNTATITSLPRDFYVNLPKLNYAGKINAVYNRAESNQKGSGPATIKEVIGGVLGTPINHYVSINFSGLTQVVDTLGGIDINVPRALYDPLFPADSGSQYAPFSIKAGLQHLDGKTALKYSRSRETTSDFDRSSRQQLVIQGIKEKALSKGIITNPAKILELVNQLASQVRTDLSVEQIKALAQVYNGVTKTNQKNAVLDTSNEIGLLDSTSDSSMGYISYPDAGMTEYKNLWRWYRFQNPDPLLVKEKPTVTVLNGGSATASTVKETIETLEDYGYTVWDQSGQTVQNPIPSTSPSPSTTTKPDTERIGFASLTHLSSKLTFGALKSGDTFKTSITTLYQNGSHPISLNYLESQFKLKSQGAKAIYSSDFVLYLGKPTPTPSPSVKPSATPVASPTSSPTS